MTDQTTALTITDFQTYTVGDHTVRAAGDQLAVRDVGDAVGYASGLSFKAHISETQKTRIGDAVMVTATARALIEACKSTSKRCAGVRHALASVEREIAAQQKDETALAAAQPTRDYTRDQAQTTNPALKHLHQLIVEFDVAQDVDAGLLCLPELAKKVMGYKDSSFLRRRLEREGVEIVEGTFPSDNVAGIKRTAAVSAAAFLDAMDYLDPQKGELRQFIDMKREYANRAVVQGGQGVDMSSLSEIISQAVEQGIQRGLKQAGQGQGQEKELLNIDGNKYAYAHLVDQPAHLRKIFRNEVKKTARTTGDEHKDVYVACYEHVTQHCVDLYRYAREHRVRKIEAAEQVHSRETPALLAAIDHAIWMRSR